MAGSSPASSVKPASQWHRLLFIDREIREGRYPNAVSMAKEYEVSDRTIKRDIEYLKDMQNAPIEYNHERRGYYYTEPSYSLPALMLSESEFFALTLAREVLKQYANTPLYGELSAVFGKLAGLLPGNVTVDAEWLGAGFTMMSQATARIDPDIWKIVFKALRQKNTLRMQYRSPLHKESHKRCLKPYHALCHKGNWYVLGHDDYSGEVRIFALSRIQKAELLKEQFDVPRDFKVSSYVDKDMGVFVKGESHRIKLHFLPEAAPFIRERDWHSGQSIEERPDGSVILSFSSNQLEETMFWVSSWGENVKVLEPEELREEIKRRLKKTLKLYAG